MYSVWLQKHQMKTILFCITCCLFVCFISINENECECFFPVYYVDELCV